MNAIRVMQIRDELSRRLIWIQTNLAYEGTDSYEVSCLNEAAAELYGEDRATYRLAKELYKETYTG